MRQWRWSRVAVRNLDLFITARTIHRTPRASLFNGKMLTAARATETNVCARIDRLDYGRRQSTFDDSSHQRCPNYWIVHRVDLPLCPLSCADFNRIWQRLNRHNILDANNPAFHRTSENQPFGCKRQRP